MIDSGLVGSMDFHSSHPQGHGRGTTRAEDAQGTPTQSHISPSILLYEEKNVFVTRSVAMRRCLRVAGEGYTTTFGGFVDF